MSGDSRGRAICVSSDPEVRRVVDGALAAAGLTVEHHDTLPPGEAGIVVAVVDRAARKSSGDALRAYGAPVVVVNDDLDDDGLVALMLEAPVSHVVTSIDPSGADANAARHLGITSAKLASGDLFGLEKYLAADVAVRERAVCSDADKRFAVDEVCAWAETVGARRSTLVRMKSVVDELLMNALHDTPKSEAECPAVLRWASDGTTLAISVGDSHGALAQRDVIDNVRRARRDRGRPRDSQTAIGSQGAGLGLYLVLANVASLIVNIERGLRTEVVCLFDLVTGPKKAVSPTRSLDVFATA